MMISENKFKGKLNCPTCLTERTFIDKSEDKSSVFYRLMF